MSYRKYTTQKKIAKMFGYANLNSFRSSSAHNRIMKGIEEIVRIVESSIQPPEPPDPQE